MELKLIKKKSSASFLIKMLLLSMVFLYTTSYSKEHIVKLSSDTAICQHENHKHTCSYQGNAKFDDNDSHLRANKIVITKSKNKLEKIVASGKNSSYSTTINTGSKKQQVDAHANLIVIDHKKNKLILEDKGKLVADKDIFEGPYIEYQFKH